MKWITRSSEPAPESEYARRRRVQNIRRRRTLCQVRGCEQQARFWLTETFGRKHLCTHHLRLQSEHAQILERIRSL